jgi:hypothetical protein
LRHRTDFLAFISPGRARNLSKDALLAAKASSLREIETLIGRTAALFIECAWITTPERYFTIGFAGIAVFAV